MPLGVVYIRHVSCMRRTKMLFTTMKKVKYSFMLASFPAKGEPGNEVSFMHAKPNTASMSHNLMDSWQIFGIQKAQ